MAVPPELALYHLAVEPVQTARIVVLVYLLMLTSFAVGTFTTGFTVTNVVPLTEQAFKVTVIEYVPVMPVVAKLLTVGFCSVEENVLGPVQA
jgi:hypothetical protein